MNTQMYTKFDKRMLVVNKILLAFLVLITVVPMVYILVASFMDPQALLSKGISFDPKDWTVEGYQRVFSDKSILRGFFNSLFYSFSFAFVTVAISVMTAYPLSKKIWSGKNGSMPSLSSLCSSVVDLFRPISWLKIWEC